MTFESVDIADLHVITGALENGAEFLCTSDATTLGYDTIGSLRIVRPFELAQELGLLDLGVSSAQVSSPGAPRD